MKELFSYDKYIEYIKEKNIFLINPKRDIG